MPNITRRIPSLLNGVSQQPASLRRASQGEQQVNCLSSLVDGLSRRNPTTVMRDVAIPTPANIFTHMFKNDVGDTMIMFMLGGAQAPSVYNLTTEVFTQSTDINSARLYMDATDPETAYQAVHVGDEIFIVNREKTVALDATVSIGTLKGTKQTFADLPTSGMINGDVWKIQGDDSVLLGSYYMKWNATTSTWEESMPPGVNTTFDPLTMPVRLYQNAANQWLLDINSWDDRQVGDTTVAPEPNFIGRAIRDMFFFRNRLGFVTSEYITMSQSGPNYLNFWRQSVRDLFDNDRIDLRANTAISTLNSAVPFNKQLLLFSNDKQLVLGAGDNQLLTPSTGVIDTVSAYSSNSVSEPVTAANSLYFASEKGLFTTIHEYATSDETEVTNVADDITAHAPSFIPANIVKIIASVNHDILIALSSTYRNRLYVYKYYWGGDQKLQSSWSYWEFDSTLGREIHSIDILDDALYIVHHRGTSSHIAKMDLSGDSSKDEIGFTVYLDDRMKGHDATATLEPGSEVLTNMSWWDEDIRGVAHLIAGPDHTSPGELLSVGEFKGTYAQFPGDIRPLVATDDCYIGRPYESRYRFSELFAREGGTDEDAAPVLNGNLQLRSMSLRLESASYLRAEVTPRPGASAFSYVFTGKILGTQSLIVGAPNIVDATYKFPILANSKRVTIDLINDTHMPSSIVSAEWSGTFNPAAGSR